MPTPPKKHRTYCKSCKDFALHSWEDKELKCETCNTIESGYNFSEVSDEKLIAQRARYKKAQSHAVGGLYQAFMMGVGIEALMNLEDSNIIEDDAGQKQIDIQIRAEKERLREEKDRIKQDYTENFSNLGRNEKCSCGSGKKYKQCHLITFRKNGII